MSIIDYIKNSYPCALVSDCSERGCKLRVDVSNYVIVKGEELCKNQRICDHIVFVERDIVRIFIVEFKSRNADSHEIEEKLTNCSMKAVEILESVGNPSFRFYHLVIAKNWRPIETKKMKEMRIPVRGKHYHVIRPKPGVSLSEVISMSE